MRIVSTIIVLLFLITILSVVAAFTLPSGDSLVVYFLNIGQGDAIFVQSPFGTQILIDGGPDRTVLTELGQVMTFFDKSIDLVVLTHPDQDHLGGLVEVLDKYTVDAVLETGVACDSALCEDWQEAIKTEGAKRYFAHAGQTLVVDDSLVVEVVAPIYAIDGQKFSNINDSSAVLKLTAGKNTILLTGDLEKGGEERLVYLYKDYLKSQILKVGHHGSKTSSSNIFLDVVQPEIAVIQSGVDNPYGHPTKAVTEALEERGITYYRNDTQGRIKVTFDDDTYYVETLSNQ